MLPGDSREVSLLCRQSNSVCWWQRCTEEGHPGSLRDSCPHMTEPIQCPVCEESELREVTCHRGNIIGQRAQGTGTREAPSS